MEYHKFYPKIGGKIRPHQKIQSVYQAKQRHAKKKDGNLIKTQCFRTLLLTSQNVANCDIRLELAPSKPP
jgi:hypothetical protein